MPTARGREGFRDEPRGDCGQKLNSPDRRFRNEVKGSSNHANSVDTLCAQIRGAPPPESGAG